MFSKLDVSAIVSENESEQLLTISRIVFVYHSLCTPLLHIVVHRLKCLLRPLPQAKLSIYFDGVLDVFEDIVDLGGDRYVKSQVVFLELSNGKFNLSNFQLNGETRTDNPVEGFDGLNEEAGPHNLLH